MDKVAHHWCAYIERICENSAKIEQAQQVTRQVVETYEQFSEDVHKVQAFLSHLQSLVQTKLVTTGNDTSGERTFWTSGPGSTKNSQDRR